jgi:hypothetical protein
MTDHIKLPRMLCEERGAPKPLRPSHQKIIENLDRWANSRELQPPKLPDNERARISSGEDAKRPPGLSSEAVS